MGDLAVDREQLIRVLAEFWPDIPFIKFETLFELTEHMDYHGDEFVGITLEEVHYILKAAGKVTDTD
jgi:hypothetical protein